MLVRAGGTGLKVSENSPKVAARASNPNDCACPTHSGEQRVGIVLRSKVPTWRGHTGEELGALFWGRLGMPRWRK
jgi:hypothetical protein